MALVAASTSNGTLCSLHQSLMMDWRWWMIIEHQIEGTMDSCALLHQGSLSAHLCSCLWW